MLGILLKVFILLKRWFCFLFNSSLDAEKILSKVWLVKRGSLMLKKWHPGFNPEKEFVRFMHLWVPMPGCPQVFWSREAFKEIGDEIGKFLFTEPQHLNGPDKQVGRMLVEVDIFGDLPKERNIGW